MFWVGNFLICVVCLIACVFCGEFTSKVARFTRRAQGDKNCNSIQSITNKVKDMDTVIEAFHENVKIRLCGKYVAYIFILLDKGRDFFLGIISVNS